MDVSKSVGRCVLALCVLPALIGPAAAAVNPNADVILVRQDCTGLNDCFSTLQSALEWTWGTRNPGPNDRLLIDIGPGRWHDQFYCDGGDGFVTARGAGRDATIILGHQGNPSGGEGSLRSAAQLSHCTDLEFIDIGFESLDFTVYWAGDGESTWTDVDIVNPGTGIGTVGCQSPDPG